jgi:hypothetical protein
MELDSSRTVADYRERQANEVEALEAIFPDGFTKITSDPAAPWNITWSPQRQPRFSLKLYPLDADESAQGQEIHLLMQVR